MAVSPLASTASMSFPRSRASCTASSTSASVPASSPGDRVPSPAAAISGVLFSALVMRGSAPRSTRVRMSSASATSDASMNGVEPGS